MSVASSSFSALAARTALPDVTFEMPDDVPAGPTFEQLARRAREGVALLRTRLWIPTWSGPSTTIERVFWLDPSAIEIVIDDAQYGRVGTHLDVQVDPTTPASVIARVRARLAPLHRRGISVDVRRARRLS